MTEFGGCPRQSHDEIAYLRVYRNAARSAPGGVVVEWDGRLLSYTRCNYMGEPQLAKSVSVGVAERNRLLGLLWRCDVLSWDNAYYCPMFDGWHWDLTIRFAEGGVFESWGSNDCPYSFESFWSGLLSIIGVSEDAR